jgi:hypothetical protein
VDDAEHMPFYILFGVIVAAMLAGIFIVQYNRQLEARVDEQAQALANDLARISFTAFSREQPSFLLPRNLGGSDYELSVDENSSTFIVHIKAGKQSGMSYYSTANVSLSIENSNFVPSGSVYFQRRSDNVVVSSSPIAAQGGNILPPATATPPDFYFENENTFYNFAKENAKAATAITAAYFSALENNQQVDVTGYEFDNGNDNIIFVQISSGGENIFGVMVGGYENQDNVGKVDNSWIVTSLTTIGNLTSPIACPSIENADNYGLLYSPAEALAYLRSRTWQIGDNLIVVPANASVHAAAATTNVSTYITWRVEWQADVYYVLHYQAMPWWAQENSPGFVFQSEPELEPVA